METMIFLSLKNGGDIMSQHDWYRLCLEIQDLLERLAHRMEGVWATESISPFQGACWGFRPMPDRDGDGDNRDDIREELAKLQKHFGGAMYWCPAEVDDIHGARSRNR